MAENEPTLAPSGEPEAPAPAPPPKRRAVDTWRDRKTTSPIWFKAASIAGRWRDPASVLLTEAEYDAAILAAQTARHGR